MGFDFSEVTSLLKPTRICLKSKAKLGKSQRTKQSPNTNETAFNPVISQPCYDTATWTHHCVIGRKEYAGWVGKRDESSKKKNGEGKEKEKEKEEEGKEESVILLRLKLGSSKVGNSNQQFVTMHVGICDLEAEEEEEEEEEGEEEGEGVVRVFVPDWVLLLIMGEEGLMDCVCSRMGVETEVFSVGVGKQRQQKRNIVRRKERKQQGKGKEEEVEEGNYGDSDNEERGDVILLKEIHPEALLMNPGSDLGGKREEGGGSVVAAPIRRAGKPTLAVLQGGRKKQGEPKPARDLFTQAVWDKLTGRFLWCGEGEEEEKEESEKRNKSFSCDNYVCVRIMGNEIMLCARLQLELEGTKKNPGAVMVDPSVRFREVTIDAGKEWNVEESLLACRTSEGIVSDQLLLEQAKVKRLPGYELEMHHMWVMLMTMRLMNRNGEGGNIAPTSSLTSSSGPPSSFFLAGATRTRSMCITTQTMPGSLGVGARWVYPYLTDKGKHQTQAGRKGTCDVLCVDMRRMIPPYAEESEVVEEIRAVCEWLLSVCRRRDIPDKEEGNEMVILVLDYMEMLRMCNVNEGGGISKKGDIDVSASSSSYMTLKDLFTLIALLTANYSCDDYVDRRTLESRLCVVGLVSDPKSEISDSEVAGDNGRPNGRLKSEANVEDALVPLVGRPNALFFESLGLFVSATSKHHNISLTRAFTERERRALIPELISDEVEKSTWWDKTLSKGNAGLFFAESAALDQFVTATDGFRVAELVRWMRTARLVAHEQRHRWERNGDMPKDALETCFRMALDEILRDKSSGSGNRHGKALSSSKRTAVVEEPQGYLKAKKKLIQSLVWPLMISNRNPTSKCGEATEGGDRRLPRLPLRMTHHHLPSGILLHGPTGCGKSLTARWILEKCCASTTSMDEHKENTVSLRAARKIIVKGSSLLSKYFGDTEQRIRALFSRAREMAPCFVFIDEIDVLLRSRGSGGEGGDGGMHQRVVATFLNEMDGIATTEVDPTRGEPFLQRRNEPSETPPVRAVVLIGCTNLPLSELDAAVLRPGRLEKIVYLDLPDEEDRLVLIRHLCETAPYVHSLFAYIEPLPNKNKEKAEGSLKQFQQWLCDSTAGFNGADICGLFNKTLLRVLSEEILSFAHIREHLQMTEGTACVQKLENINLKDLFSVHLPFQVITEKSGW
eukprot:Nk52_evm32s1485 gene=Nk52_evmTU32s1485